MKRAVIQPPDTRSSCAYCGHRLDESMTEERFGERFCSGAHAEEFAAGVRAARIQRAADHANARHDATGDMTACAVPPAGQRSWRDRLKRGLCWGAPLVLLVAMPLIWIGGWAANGGSLLTVAALLACPLGMYFMMRGMMSMQHPKEPAQAERGKEDANA